MEAGNDATFHPRSRHSMNSNALQFFAIVFVALSSLISVRGADNSSASAIHHSYLVLGGKTAIIDEDGKVQWEFRGGSRDGFVLPNGNVLMAFADHVEEVVPANVRLN